MGTLAGVLFCKCVLLELRCGPGVKSQVLLWQGNQVRFLAHMLDGSSVILDQRYPLVSVGICTYTHTHTHTHFKIKHYTSGAREMAQQLTDCTSVCSSSTYTKIGMTQKYSRPLHTNSESVPYFTTQLLHLRL